jgi:hypothetical protein
MEDAATTGGEVGGGGNKEAEKEIKKISKKKVGNTVWCITQRLSEGETRTQQYLFRKKNTAIAFAKATYCRYCKTAARRAAKNQIAGFKKLRKEM